MNNMLDKLKSYFKPFFMYRNWTKYAVYTSIMISLVLFDVFTKIGVFHIYLDKYGEIPQNVSSIDSNIYSFFGMIHIRLSFNTGAAFSFLSNEAIGKILLPILSLVMFIVMFYFYTVYFDRIPEFFILALVLIISGCFGNLVDRFGRLAQNPYYFRGVIDFIDVSHIFPFKAIFNIADVCVVASFVTIIFGLIYMGINTILVNKNKSLIKNEEIN